MTQQPPIAPTFDTQLPEVVDLFTLDITLLLPAGSPDQAIYNFCNWTQVNGNDVVYDGVTYTALPLQASGFELNTSGQLERPSITFANVGLAITGLTNTYSDLVGATVKRIRTLTTYLDGEPAADPDAYWGPDEWGVEQKTSENKLAVTFQLSVPFDLEGRSLPGRRLLRFAVGRGIGNLRRDAFSLRNGSDIEHRQQMHVGHARIAKCAQMAHARRAGFGEGQIFAAPRRAQLY